MRIPWLSMLVVLASTAWMWVGCSTPPTGVEEPPEVAPYRPVTNILETMQWILDPAADTIWDSAGFVITAEGETDLAPTTRDGWLHVRNHAAIVAETGNLLMMPGRAAGPEWIAFASALTTAGEHAIAAAEGEDAAALFDAGGEIYQACRGCHAVYMLRSADAVGSP